MKRTEAINAVLRAAQAVPTIEATDITGSGYSLRAVLTVQDGRSITVLPDYGCGDYWGGQTNCASLADRVLLKAGDMLDSMSRFGSKAATRTFRVRKDGTLNEAGMTKALTELAAAQVDDVKRRAERTAETDAHIAASIAAMRHLHEVTGKFYDEQFQMPTRRGKVQAGDYAVDMTVRESGNVKIVLDDLPVAAVEEFLTLLGFEKSDATV